MARPRLTDEVRERIIGALQAGADMALAAQLVGCHRATLYKWFKKDPEFKQRTEEARAIADDRVVKSLYDEALKGNTTAMIFWLKNRRPLEWRDRRELKQEVSGANGEPIEYRAVFDDGAPVAPPPAGVPAEPHP